jgi:RNA polymerase sigma factor (sigma-70 family)
MKITDPGADDLRAATAGGLDALDRVILAIQPGVFNLALRMLGHRDDAADATQEILLKVVTHLASFRGESAFPTWVFRIARNHLLTASTRSRESPEVSLESIGERLRQGLELGASVGEQSGSPPSLTPQDKLEARQVALGCTQSMLMALDREQRLVYVLDVVFGLSSAQAAQVLETTPQAYRQRLSRARSRLDAFVGKTCGWARREAPCTCERQLPAIRHLKAGGGTPRAAPIAIVPVELDEAARQFDALLRLGDAAAVFRAHPQYRAPDAQRGAIRAVLRAEGMLGDDRPLH